MKKRILKIAIVLLLTVVVVFLSLVAAVRYFFPAEVVREELESLLSSRVGATVTIQSLAFDILNGLQAEQIDVRRDQQRLAHLETLSLEYSLWRVLFGQLVVDEIVLDRAEVTVNLRDLGTQFPQEQEPSGVPIIPLMLDVRTIVVKDSRVRVHKEGEFDVRLRGITLEASVGASPLTADLSGRLEVEEAGIVLDGKGVKLPLEVEFAASASLPSETIEVTDVTLRLGSAIRASLSGRVDQFRTKRSVDVNLKNVEVDWERVVILAKEFLPDEMKGARITGKGTGGLTLQGVLLDSGFDGVVRGEVRGTDLQGTFPGFNAVAEAGSLIVQMTDIPVRRNQIESVAAELTVTAAAVGFPSYAADEMNGHLVGTYVPAGRLSATLDLKGRVKVHPQAASGTVDEPFEIRATGSGDLRKGGLALDEATVNIGSFGHALLRGTVSPSEQPGEQREVSLVAEVTPNLATVLQSLPEGQLRGLELQKQGQPDLIRVEMNAKVDSSFAPLDIKVLTAVHLRSVTTSMPEVAARANVEDADLVVQGTYQAKTGRIQGKLTGDLALSNLQYGTMVEAENTKLQVSGTFNGKISRDRGVEDLVSHNSIRASLKDVRYRNPSIAANVDDLVLSTEATVDLAAETYRFEKLRAASGSLFELTGAGTYRAEDRHLTVKAALPLVDIGELLRHVSGDGVQAVHRAKPRGRVSVQVTGVGTVPSGEEVDLLRLPATLACEVTLEDVHAAVEDHEVAGANGTITVSLQPGDKQKLKASTDLRAESLKLPADFGLGQAEGVFAEIDATLEDFDRASLRKVHVGLNGVDVSVTGSLAGLRGFLEEGQLRPRQRLEALSLDVRSQGSLDMEKASAFLASHGIQGSGEAKFALSVRKQERGAIDLQLEVDPHRLEIVNDGTRLVNLNGGLWVRKVLDWIPGEADARPPTRERPAQPKPFSPKRRSLTADRVDFGPVRISDLSSEVEFERRRLRVEKLAMNLLGGTAGGSVRFEGGKRFSVETNLQFARLNLNELLGPSRRLKGDSVVEGLVNLTAAFDGERGSIDLERTEGEIHISRIGRRALDRLLLFFDPEGLNPSIVGARSAIMLANPKEVRATLSKGSLGLKIKFQTGLLSRFSVKSIPISDLPFVQDVTQVIPEWDRIKRAMLLLGAQRYSIGADGSLIVE